MKGVSGKYLTIKPEYCFCWLLSWFWVEYTILPYVLQIYKRIPIFGEIYEYIFDIVFFVLLLMSGTYLLKKIKSIDVVFYLITTLVVLCTMILLPANSVYITEKLFKILITGVPMYFIGISYDHENSKNILYYASLIGVIVTLAYQLYKISTGQILIADNMDAAYKTLPSTMYLIYMLFEDTSLKNILSATIGIILIIAFGTRGPILAMMIYILMAFYFKFCQMTSFMTRSLLVGFSCLILLALTAGETFISLMSKLLVLFEKIGFSTRIFEMYLIGDIADGSGRNILYKTIIDAINQKPLLGYGLMGDRVILGKYVHNIFLEIWCDFGIIIGSLLIIAMILLFVCALYRQRSNSSFYFLLALICMILVKLNLSGSFVNDQYFYLILGISVAFCRTKERRNVV